MNNKDMLDFLFNSEQIDINRGNIFNTEPGNLPDNFDFDRIEGLMIGLAVGDSLGVSTESMPPGLRRVIYGEIRDYFSGWFGGKPIGYPSDDTQLAFWTLDQMIEDGGLDPERLSKRFCSKRIFGIGRTVLKFLYNYKLRKLPWYKCGPKSAGNGALMRIAPMVIPYLKTGDKQMWVDTALSAMITHNDSGSISACLSFINIIWQVLKMDKPPDPSWWIDTYINTAKGLEIDHTYRTRSGKFKGYEGAIHEFVDKHAREAYERDIPIYDACKAWNSGAYLLETVPSVLYILMRHGNDPEEAIIRAINDTVDNDTVGAIVGAVVGALHGKKGIPGRWVENLSGRTSKDDDGKIFEIIERAKNNFHA